MTNKLYIVKRGDSLERIANAHKVKREEIARLNNLSNINYIKIGQHLIIPPPVEETSIMTEMAKEAGQLYIRFIDSVGKPIDKLKTIVKVAQEKFEFTTDSKGVIPAIAINENNTKVTVEVEKAAGGTKEVSEFNADTEQFTAARIASPKTAVAFNLKRHEGKAPEQTQTEKLKKAGTVIDTRSPAGHPVKQFPNECPNEGNLKLEANDKYRKILLEEQKRSGLQSQAIAALMDAEAGRIKIPLIRNGKQVYRVDKKTKEKEMAFEATEEWDPKSKNPNSSATGVTQLLDGTWIHLALKEGTFLNDFLKSKGWYLKVPKVPAKIKSNKPLKPDKPKFEKAFKLANGTLVTGTSGKKPKSLERVLSAKPYLTGRRKASDPNLQQLLDLRYDPEYSIRTGVDYGIENMAIAKKSFNIDMLNDGEKAKIMYLYHHLGAGDAPKFIKKEFTPEHAKYILICQVGEDKAAEWVAANKGDYIAGHRDWLTEFIDTNIKTSKHVCNASSAVPVRDMEDIITAIRRK